jgi:hypothetical protein
MIFAFVLYSKYIRTVVYVVWVFPWRQIVVCRRFGTLCQFHLQRLDVEYEAQII